MRSFGDLAFLTTGKGYSGQQRGYEIIRDLELFSGSLYFESFPAYESFHHFLGWSRAVAVIFQKAESPPMDLLMKKRDNWLAGPHSHRSDTTPCPF